MRRVVIDARKFEDSGIGTYLRGVAPGVIRQMPEIRFTVLGQSAALSPALGDLGNVSIIECPVKPLSISEQLELPRFIPSSTDLFWAPHFNIPLAYRGKLLVTIHDILPMAMPERTGGRAHEVYVRTMMTKVRSSRAQVIAVSDFTAKELVRLARLDAGRIAVIPEAADVSWRSVAKGANPRPRPYLLYVGLVKPHKNLLGLLKAFDLLRRRIPHDLIIVGDRERIAVRDDESARFAERFGERVVFTGHTGEGELKQYFAHADALVQPSFYEGFGLPPLEAMNCGCPVVSSNAASLPEVCGEAAEYFDPADTAAIAAAIERVVGDPMRRAEMVELGRMNAARFSWERAAEETAKVIRSALG